MVLVRSTKRGKRREKEMQWQPPTPQQHSYTIFHRWILGVVWDAMGQDEGKDHVQNGPTHTPHTAPQGTGAPQTTTDSKHRTRGTRA